eukprot:TRINITY_DN3016_c0_g1_i1.p1 TRINITY_DN3016_c0_g1~~TRINITY_DN3016_c0_g1_i1.p1  ORF type:complete len:691 (-),score=178.46 TRINITY_DN3016_c0_g1_i1:148-2220(-)
MNTTRSTSTGRSRPNTSSNSPNGSDELTDLKKRFHLLEGDKKAYYETTQWTIQQNTERLTNLKNENKDLQQQRSSLQREIEQYVEGKHEVERYTVQLVELKKKYDEIHHAFEQKEKDLAILKDKQRELQKETLPSQHEAPLQIKLRALEQKWSKIMTHSNEAATLKNTYEQIISKLGEDRVSFDGNVDVLEKTLQAKEKELSELTQLYQDALDSKTLAKEELTKFERIAADEKKKRETIIESKKQQLRHLMETNERQERKMRREEQRRSEFEAMQRSLPPPKSENSNDANNGEEISWDDFESAFRDIKESTGVSDINEMYQKVQSQEETFKNLLALKKESQAKVEAITKERDALRNRITEIRFSDNNKNNSNDNNNSANNLSLGGRRDLDEMELKLAEADAKFQKNRQKYEKMARILINVRAGVEHVYSKLAFYDDTQNTPHQNLTSSQTLSVPPSPSSNDGSSGTSSPKLNLSVTSLNQSQTTNSISDESILEFLRMCEQKLIKMMQVTELSSNFTLKSNFSSPSNSQPSSRPSSGIKSASENDNDLPFEVPPLPPSYNIRVKLVYNDDTNEKLDLSSTLSLNDEDDPEIPTRQAIKQRSNEIVDRELKKSKRRPKKKDVSLTTSAPPSLPLTSTYSSRQIPSVALPSSPSTMNKAKSARGSAPTTFRTPRSPMASSKIDSLTSSRGKI